VWCASALHGRSIEATLVLDEASVVTFLFPPQCIVMRKDFMMNAHHTTPARKSLHTLGAVLTALGICALLALAAPAQARERQGSVIGPKGQTATRDVSRMQGDVSSSTTGPRGQTASREVDRSSTGTTATVTGPRGKSGSRSTTRTGTGSDTTVTGPNGQTGAVTVTRQPS
jgi:hypothetical protein